MNQKCFICDQPASAGSYGDFSGYAADCAICGKYVITDVIRDDINEYPDIKHKLKILMRERALHGLSSVAICREQPANPNPAISFPFINIDDFLSHFPKNVSDRINRSLKNLAASSRFPGDKFKFDVDSSSLIFTESGQINEVFFLINQLLADGLIDGRAGYPQDLIVTVKGWNKVAELEEHSVTNSSQAFVAMWFSDEVDTVYEEGIKRAITDAGFDPIRIDKKEHNNKIDDEIIAEIKNSKFVIADFTGHRGGVYFEAGFGMGLGKPVIWTCKEDHLADLHFDTRQYSHIVWKDPADLYQKLFNRIRATIL